MEKFQHLLRPMAIAGKTLKNRMIASPMSCLSINDDGSLDESVFGRILAKASGGCSVVTVGETPVDFDYANRDHHARVTDYTDFNSIEFAAYRRATKAFHDAGALALIQLFHCGDSRLAVDGNVDAYGPVSYVSGEGIAVKALDERAMEAVENSFATAAYYMKRAGFDGVNIHAGHGWLLAQFLSSVHNTRTDRYGGSLANRCRFPLRIIRKVREKCGGDFIVEVRVSGEEVVENGVSLDEMVWFCKQLEGTADMVHVSAGIYRDPMRSRMMSSMFHEHGCNVEVAAYIKARVNIPVAVVGGINSPEQAEMWIASGKCDFVALGRQMIADPEFPAKAAAGRADDINRCLRCGRCFPGPYEVALRLNILLPGCTVNPMFDRPPSEGLLRPAAAPKKVLVVGGGCGGMQAAVTAAQRGHRVTLAEAGGALGGILKFADIDPHKADLKNFKDLLVSRVARMGVRVLLNTRADEGLIAREAPDCIIAAVGSSPIVPRLPGAENGLSALDAYDGDTGVGKRVVIVGGGLVGCETALYLAEAGKDVTVVEMAQTLAPDAYPLHREAVIDEMDRHCAYRTGYTCTRISRDGVYALNRAGEERLFRADTVFFAVGMRANSAELESLRRAAGTLPFYAAGDCVKARKVYDSVYEGCSAALKI